MSTLDQVRTVVAEVGKPVNVLAPPIRGVTVEELAEAGAKRISVGGTLARAAAATLLEAGRMMLDGGRFDWASGATATEDLASVLGSWVN